MPRADFSDGSLLWPFPAAAQDGVVLGADTRATNDTVVADKNCEKIHYIADNIYCCGAGTAADTENTTGTWGSVLLAAGHCVRCTICLAGQLLVLRVLTCAHLCHSVCRDDRL